MFLVTYFSVFILSHKENIHLYSFGIEWVTDIKWTGNKIQSALGRSGLSHVKMKILY